MVLVYLKGPDRLGYLGQDAAQFGYFLALPANCRRAFPDRVRRLPSRVIRAGQDCRFGPLLPDVVEDRSYDAADNASFHRLTIHFPWNVLFNRVGQLGNGQSL